jgi:hypothetical protein
MMAEFDDDSLARIAAVMRRLYSQDRMSGDTMRNAAQMLDAVLEREVPSFNKYKRHVTYDSRLKGVQS